VELVKFTPGMDPAAWDYLDSKDGVVIEEPDSATFTPTSSRGSRR